MSLFISPVKQFKCKYTETNNLMINYSFGHLNVSDLLAIKKIEVAYMETIELAKKVSDPFNSFFNFYLGTSVKTISVGCALLVLTNALEFIIHGEVLNKITLENMLLIAQDDITTEKGKWFVKSILENNTDEMFNFNDISDL